MPENLKRNPEELWQLDKHSPNPDEVEIVVPDDRPFKGYITPQGDPIPLFQRTILLR